MPFPNEMRCKVRELHFFRQKRHLERQKVRTYRRLLARYMHGKTTTQEAPSTGRAILVRMHICEQYALLGKRADEGRRGPRAIGLDVSIAEIVDKN